MKKNHEFYRSGNLYVSVEIDKNVCFEAVRRGSAGVYGVYELGRSYVAQISEGKPIFNGFSNNEAQKIKIVNQNEFNLEEGKYYAFCLTKIELGFCRRLHKIKFRAIKEVDLASLK